MKKAVEEAKAAGNTSATAEVKLDIRSGNKDVNSVELSVPADAVKAIADAKDVSLKITSDTADITLDASTLAGIASRLKDGETLKITADVVDNKTTLSAEQQKLAGDNPVIEFSITAGDSKVSSFDGTVTVSVPYTPPASLAAGDRDLLTVYYLDDNDNLIEMQDAKYDAVTGMITFTTGHFSKFMIAEWLNPFTDAKKSDWFYKAMRYTYSGGLMNGTEADKFAPNANLTRAMLITILARESGVDTNGGETWYSKAVEWGVKNNVTDGSNLTGDITREQLATMLYRHAGLGDGWSGPALEWAQEQKIMNDGRGGDTATRAEVATMLMRYIESLGK